MNIKKILFISTILFVLFSFSLIFINFNGLQFLFGKKAEAQADITTGLVGHWKFDEGAGTTASDSSGNNNTGVLTNGPAWTTGKIGGALSFDGVDDYVNLSSSPLSGNTDLTHSLWIKPDFSSLSNNVYILLDIGQVSPSYQSRIVLYWRDSAQGWRWHFWDDSGAENFQNIPYSFSAGQWLHLVAIRQSGTKKFYINNVNVLDTAYTLGAITLTGKPATIGAQVQNGQYPFDGLIDEVRIYNRALTQAEITELYNYTGGATPPSDTTPPVLSSGSPTGALPAGTTQTTVSVEVTDASSPVSCKYSQTSGTAYSSMTETLSTANGTTFTATVTGLTNGTSYNYYIRCQDTAGNANITDYTISFSVASPPPPAGDITSPVVSITSPTNGITVSGTITISANATDNVAVAGVQFKLDTTTNLGTEDTTSPFSYSLNTTTITDGSHTLIAVARDTSNNYATSSIITITVNNASPPPPDITLPSIPTGLIATAISSSQINLSWTASTDNVAVTGYRVYRNGIQITTTTTTSYSDTGLLPSTSYTYSVVAYDGAGNTSAQSASVSATTPALSSNPIDNLKPGEWYEVSNSHLRDVAPCDGKHGPNEPNVCNPSKGDPTEACYDSYAISNIGHIIWGWNGGAFDTKRDRLLIWGGWPWRLGRE